LRISLSPVILLPNWRTTLKGMILAKHPVFASVRYLSNRIKKMRKVVLAAVLWLFCSAANAEWVKIDTDSETDVYVDPATHRRSGERVKIWVIFDQKKPMTWQGMTLRSIRGHEEFNCNDEIKRSLHESIYSGRMGAGDMMWASDTLDASWSSVAPRSKWSRVFGYACGK
jgi:hypothetical protein